MVRQASPAAAPVVRILYRAILLPAVFRPLVVPVEVYVALPPRYVPVARVLLVLRMLMTRKLVPAFFGQPLLALLMEPAFLSKTADVAGLPLTLVQVYRRRRLAPAALEIIEVPVTLKVLRLLLPAVARVPVVWVAWVVFVVMHG